MIKWVFVALSLLYLYLYPSILLVPVEYREGFWSAAYNVPRRGVITEREIVETKAIFSEKAVHRIGVLANGNEEYFWAANSAIVNKLRTGELVQFETRGRVIVLATPETGKPVIVSLLNY